MADPADVEVVWAGRARMALARLAAGARLDGVDLHALDRHYLGLGVPPPRRQLQSLLRGLARDLREVAAWMEDNWPAGLAAPCLAPVDPDREGCAVMIWLHCADAAAMARAAQVLGVRPAMVTARAGYVRASRRVGLVRVEAWCRTPIWAEQAAA